MYKNTNELLLHLRELLYKRTKRWYPVLEAMVLLDGMDDVEYFEDDTVLEITFRFDKVLPVIQSA